MKKIQISQTSTIAMNVAAWHENKRRRERRARAVSFVRNFNPVLR